MKTKELAGTLLELSNELSDKEDKLNVLCQKQKEEYEKVYPLIKDYFKSIDESFVVYCFEINAECEVYIGYRGKGEIYQLIRIIYNNELHLSRIKPIFDATYYKDELDIYKKCMDSLMKLDEATLRKSESFMIKNVSNLANRYYEIIGLKNEIYDISRERDLLANKLKQR